MTVTGVSPAPAAIIRRPSRSSIQTAISALSAIITAGTSCCSRMRIGIEPLGQRENQMTIRHLAAMAALLFVQLSCGNHEAAAPQAAAQSAGTPWRTLFNGHDLEGSVPVGTAQWRVEEGIIVGGQDGDPKRSGLLTSKDSFKDFE